MKKTDTTEGEVPPSPTPHRGAGHRRRGPWMAVVIVLLLLVGGVAAGLPSILSLPAVRRAVLAKVNAAGQGTLDVRSWTLGWRSGLRLDGLTYTDQPQETRISVRHVAVATPLWRFLRRDIDLGVVDVVEPVVDMVLTPVTAETKTPAETRSARPRPSTPPSKPGVSGAPSAPVLPVREIKGSLKVDQGRIRMAVSGTDRVLVIDTLNATLAAGGPGHPVTFDVSGVQGGYGGRFAVQGMVEWPENGRFDLPHLTACVRASLDQFELEPIGAVAQAVSHAPDMRGKLNATLSISNQAPETATVDLTVRASSLAMTGGVLGEDKPFFDQARLELGFTRDAQGLVIHRGEVEMPAARMSVTGRFANKPDARFPIGTATADGRVDLPGLAALFPHTLRMKEGLTVTGGAVTVQAEVESIPDELTYRCRAALQDLVAGHGKQTYTLDDPVSLRVQGAFGWDGMKVDELVLNSSFLRAQGRGTQKDMEVEIAADLATAAKEIGQFVDLGKLELGGQVSVRSRLLSVSDRVRKASVDVSLEDLRVAGVTPRPLTQESVRFTLSGRGEMGDQNQIQDFADVTAVLRAPLLQAGLSARRIRREPDAWASTVEKLDVTADGDLAALAAFAYDAGLVTARVDVAGHASLSAQGGLQNRDATLLKGTLQVKDLVFRDGAKRLSEPLLALSGRGRLNGDRREVDATDGSLTFSAGQIAIPTVRVRGGDAKLGDVTLKADMAVDLAKLSAMLDGFSPLPADVGVAGSLRANLDLPGGGTGPLPVRGEVLVNDGVIRRPGGVEIHEKESRLTFKGHVDTSGKRVNADVLRLQSGPIRLDVSGALTDWDSSRQLAAKGTLECDWARIAELVSIVTGQPRLEVEGKRETPLAIQASLGGRDWRAMAAGADASAELYVQRLKWFGIETGEMTPTLTVKDAQARLRMETVVNEGRLSLPSVVDLGAERAILSMPTNTLVLDRVKLTDDLLSGLLSRINPLLGGCGAVSGRVSLAMDRLQVPLDQNLKRDLSLSGQVRFEDVVLAPEGLLKQVLAAAKTDNPRVTITNQTVSFVCEKGRVTPSPLRLQAGECDLTFSGSMGLDQTLSYEADMPVTKGMVGEKVFPYVADARVKLVIGGTVTRPRISGDSFEATIRDLMKSAGQKLLLEEAQKMLRRPPAPVAPAASADAPAETGVAPASSTNAPASSVSDTERLIEEGVQLLDGFLKKKK